jgi:hypothetical protein
MQRHFLGIDPSNDHYWQLGAQEVDLDLVQARNRVSEGEQ